MASLQVTRAALHVAHTTLETENRILLKNQIVRVTGIDKAIRNPSKVGDGVSNYNTLPFIDTLQLETDVDYDLTQSFITIN